MSDAAEIVALDVFEAAQAAGEPPTRGAGQAEGRRTARASAGVRLWAL
jgi:hypothetical protein